MSALLESLAEAFRGNAEQRRMLDAVVRTGLPAARNEAWKYTSLRALERRTFAQAAEVVVDRSIVAHIPAPRLVFVNGRHDASLSDLAGIGVGVTLQPLSMPLQLDPSSLQARAPGEAPFAHLALALGTDGVVLRIDAGIHVDNPIAVVHIGAPENRDIAWHARHRIVLESGARAVLVEHHLHTRPHANLGNALVEIAIGAAASLLHARMQVESDTSSLFTYTHANLQRDADYQRIDLELGGALSRHELNVQLLGDGASVRSNGVLLGTGRRHLDTRLAIEHVAPNTVCDLLWRGLASGRSRCVFHGGIVIQPGSDGAEARLSNKNLLLSQQAEIDTQPVLEIHADEVKAAHGATVGQLDPTALFYLRSRGLSEAQSRQLLTGAFCKDVIASIHAPALREQLGLALEQALASLEIA